MVTSARKVHLHVGTGIMHNKVNPIDVLASCTASAPLQLRRRADGRGKLAHDLLCLDAAKPFAHARAIEHAYSNSAGNFSNGAFVAGDRENIFYIRRAAGDGAMAFWDSLRIASDDLSTVLLAKDSLNARTYTTATSIT